MITPLDKELQEFYKYKNHLKHLEDIEFIKNNPPGFPEDTLEDKARKQHMIDGMNHSREFALKHYPEFFGERLH